jgi:hypothetical protein
MKILRDPTNGRMTSSSLVLALLASGQQQSMPAMAASFPGTYATGQAPSAHLTPTTNLSYHGGPVMVDSVTTYAIFWEPTGSYVSPTYNSLILQYFNDVGGVSALSQHHAVLQLPWQVSSQLCSGRFLGGYAALSRQPALGIANSARSHACHADQWLDPFHEHNLLCLFRQGGRSCAPS